MVRVGLGPGLRGCGAASPAPRGHHWGAELVLGPKPSPPLGQPQVVHPGRRFDPRRLPGPHEDFDGGVLKQPLRVMVPNEAENTQVSHCEEQAETKRIVTQNETCAQASWLNWIA